MIIEPPSTAPRLSLRHVHDGSASDVVGHLVAANDQWYVLLPEDRPAVWVRRDQTRGLRRVPERSVLDSSRPNDLERTLDRARPTTRRARLGGWRLSDGLVVAVGDPGLPRAEAVQAALEWIGAPTVFRFVEGDQEWADLGPGHEVVKARAVLTAPSTVPRVDGSLPLTRGSVLEVPASDDTAIRRACAAGYTQRYRALLVTLA